MIQSQLLIHFPRRYIPETLAPHSFYRCVEFLKVKSPVRFSYSHLNFHLSLILSLYNNFDVVVFFLPLAITNGITNVAGAFYINDTFGIAKQLGWMSYPLGMTSFTYESGTIIGCSLTWFLVVAHPNSSRLECTWGNHRDETSPLRRSKTSRRNKEMISMILPGSLEWNR